PPHVPCSKHARTAQAMVLLGLREGSFDRLFPPSINTLATMRFRKGIDPLQRPLPHMPLHHLSVHTRPETFCSSRTPLACPAFTAVLPVSLPRRGLPGKTLFLRSDVFVADWIIAKSVLPVVRSFVCVPSVANYPLYPLRLQQMRYPCVVVSRVQSHVFGQRAQPCFDLVEYFGHR